MCRNTEPYRPPITAHIDGLLAIRPQENLSFYLFESLKADVLADTTKNQLPQIERCGSRVTDTVSRQLAFSQRGREPFLKSAGSYTLRVPNSQRETHTQKKRAV
jgi:hypothetical protein